MTEDECRAFVIKAVSHAMARDGSSGGCIRTVTISKDGVKRTFTPGEFACSRVCALHAAGVVSTFEEPGCGFLAFAIVPTSWQPCSWAAIILHFDHFIDESRLLFLLALQGIRCQWRRVSCRRHSVQCRRRCSECMLVQTNCMRISLKAQTCNISCAHLGVQKEARVGRALVAQERVEHMAAAPTLKACQLHRSELCANTTF